MLEQTDLLSELGHPQAAPATPAPVSTPVDHGPATRLFDSPQTIAGQLAMTTDTLTGD